MRPLALAFLLLLGCDGGPVGTDAGACSPGFGILEVCVYSDMTSTAPSAGAVVTARRSATDVPFVMRAPEGCSHEELEVGTWELSGNDPSGTCPTPFEPVTITACETTSLRVEYINSCVDG